VAVDPSPREAAFRNRTRIAGSAEVEAGDRPAVVVRHPHSPAADSEGEGLQRAQAEGPSDDAVVHGIDLPEGRRVLHRVEERRRVAGVEWGNYDASYQVI
jgi:hypothetical protein